MSSASGDSETKHALHQDPLQGDSHGACRPETAPLPQPLTQAGHSLSTASS